MKRSALLLTALIFVSLIASALANELLAQPPPGHSYRQWAVGDWKLLQYYQDITYSGTLSIKREGGRYFGQIYFDSLGAWEPLEGIEVSNDTIQFYRPMYGGQNFRGHHHGGEISGRWDSPTQGEWRWSAR